MTDSTNPIQPARTALLVMDYQTAIIGMLEHPEPLLANAERAIRTVRDCGGHVGYVRVAFTDAEAAAIPERNKGFWSMRASAKGFSVDAPATAIDARIAPKDGDIVVRKSRVGAFSTTDLADRLGARGVDTLILAGISTSGVVLSTIRDAADRDFRLFVLSDACADPQADVHALLVDKVFPRQAGVMTTGDFGVLFRSQTPNR